MCDTKGQCPSLSDAGPSPCLLAHASFTRWPVLWGHHSAGAVFTVWSCLGRVGSALLDTRIFGNLLHLQAFVPPGKTEDLMSDCAFRGSHTRDDPARCGNADQQHKRCQKLHQHHRRLLLPLIRGRGIYSRHFLLILQKDDFQEDFWGKKSACCY